jgi:branched-chain amino acid transport system permease protein
MRDGPDTMGALERSWPVLGLIIMVGAITLATYASSSPTLSRTVTEALVRIVVVVGIYIFVGNSGVLSFGHISFMAIGAYGTAWQTCCPQLKPFTMRGLPDFLVHTTVPALPAALAGGALAAGFGLAIGTVIMRLSGVAASIATLALLFIINVIYSNWQSVTLGKGSLVGLPTYVTPAVAFAWVAVALVAAFGYQRSRFGLELRATREDEVTARALGINVYRQRLIAFTLSAFFVGIGGVLYGHFLGVISIDVFFLDTTFLTLAMLVVGGMRSLAGAVVGVLVISTVIEFLRQLETGIAVGALVLSVPSGTQEIVLAVAMLLIFLYRPRGIMAGRELPWIFRRSPARSIEHPALDKAP